MTAPLGVLLAGFAGLGEGQNHQRDMYQPGFEAHPGFTVVGTMDTPDALERSDVDVVSVCVPMKQRVEVVTTALRAGKHVLVDKPMALTVAECTAIADAAREAGRVCLPAHHQRFNPMVSAARAAVANGQIGLPWNVQADLLVAGGPPVEHGEIDNFALYPVDIVLALTGQPVHRVHARAARRRDGAGPEDLAVLMLDHAHGITGTVVVGRIGELAGLPPGGVAVHRYRVSGSHGVLDVDATRPAVAVHTGAALSTRWSGPASVERMLDELRAAVVANLPSQPGPSDARQVAAVIEAAHQSIAHGRPVDVPAPPTAEVAS